MEKQMNRKRQLNEREQLKSLRKALLVTHVSGFVPQFEMNNVRILQSMGYEVHYASNFNTPSYGTDNHRLENREKIRGMIRWHMRCGRRISGACSFMRGSIRTGSRGI